MIKKQKYFLFLPLRFSLYWKFFPHSLCISLYRQLGDTPRVRNKKLTKLDPKR